MAAFKTIQGQTPFDSTVSIKAWAIPLVDSLTGAPFSAPYIRVHVFSTALVQNTYLHIIGRSQ